MNTVKFYGWNKGVRKIKFIFLLHRQGGMTLKKAKEIKDKVVGGGEIVELNFDDSVLAEKICSQAKEIGIKCELI